LQIVEHVVPHDVMKRRCARYVARYGGDPLACAEFNFDEGRCDIWYSAGVGLRANLVRHERLHCAGYDHPGENAMARMLGAWKRGHVFSARLTPERASED
jgi:hypothetical protein